MLYYKQNKQKLIDVNKKKVLIIELNTRFCLFLAGKYCYHKYFFGIQSR